MNSLRASMMIPLFGLLTTVAACSGQTPNESAASTANAVGATATGANAEPAHHGRHLGHGPESLLFVALHEDLGLSADQKTKIEAARATLETGEGKPDFAAKHKALADAIRAGKVDVAALAPPKPDQAQLDARRAQLATALTTLHSTLTKDQRTALVAAIEKHEGGFEKHDGKKDGPKGFGKGGGFGPMHLLEGLDLTQDQQDAIHAQLAANAPAAPPDLAAMKAQHEAMRKEMDARLQTFVGDDFDASAFIAPPKDAPPMAFGARKDRMLEDLAIVVPLLTPAQREALAAKIEQGPHPHE